MPFPVRFPAIVVAGLIFGLGCESEVEQADRAVEENVRAARNERGEAAVTAGFQKAAAEVNASPASSAHAKVLLAQAKTEQARSILQDVNNNEIAIARLVGEIGDIAGQVERINAVVAGYEELSEQAGAAVGKSLEDKRAQVQGTAAGDVWKPEADGGELPALSNAAAREAELGPKIAELQAKKAELLKQRTAADAKAADLLRQSKRKTGKESVDLYTQSAEQTKAAADAATEIAKVDHQLLKLEQDLALAKAQQEQLDVAVKGLAERVEQNKKSQEELAQSIEAHRALAKALVYGDGSTPPPADTGDTATPPADAPPVEGAGNAEPAAFQETDTPPAEEEQLAPTEAAPAEPATDDAAVAETADPTDAAPKTSQSTIFTNSTMAAKAKELSQYVSDTAAKRKTALDLLTEALGHYDGAIADVMKLRGQLQQDMNDPNVRGMPQADAWKQLSDTLSPGALGLAKANVQMRIASLHRDAVTSLAARGRMLEMVVPILKEGKIEMPPELLAPKLEAELAEHQTAANEAYDATDALLKDEVVEKVTGSSPADTATRNAGVIAQVVSHYGRAQLARATGDQATADKLINSARQYVQSGAIAVEDFPPYVRRSLGIKVAEPTTAPAPPAEPDAGPGTEPATAPADAEAAPTDAAPDDSASDAAPQPAEGQPAPEAQPPAPPVE